MGDDKKPELMTVKEVAAMLRVDRKTVARWRDLGRLKAFRIGVVVRFRRKDVLAAMEKYEYGGPPKKDPSMW